MSEPTPNPAVFRAYWRFAAERHSIFERRLRDSHGPWTEDQILRDYRFCNAFRAADRVTQELIAVAYVEPSLKPSDIFLRTVLFRLFSRPETWRLIESDVGTITAENFDPKRLGDRLEKARSAGATLYTGAFILCADAAYGYRRKHRNHLALLDAMLVAELPARVEAAAGLGEVYDLLLDWPLIGPFMAYQLAIDLNYTTVIDFDENEFTVPGPGAVRGLRKVFADLNGMSEAEAIHWLVDYQARCEDELAIVPPRLFGRTLHAIDAQNLLCEIDKYARVAFPELRSNRKRIKQRFKADSDPLPLAFPPKWGLRGLSKSALPTRVRVA
ncbi:MAG TPA: nucleotide kinase domain-containing protein [Solirubrobacterales bacterium]|nr:nucleotide kinase domain-containing protein [Solirubrobacterales bacterium]